MQSDVKDARRQDWFWLDNILTDIMLPIIGVSAFSVYCVLARHANRERECYPSVPTIMDATGFSRNTVAKCIAGLEAHQMIQRQARYDGEGRQTSNLYVLLDREHWSLTKLETSDPETEPQIEQGGVNLSIPAPPKNGEGGVNLRGGGPPKQMGGSYLEGILPANKTPNTPTESNKTRGAGEKRQGADAKIVQPDLFATDSFHQRESESERPLLNGSPAVATGPVGVGKSPAKQAAQNPAPPHGARQALAPASANPSAKQGHSVSKAAAPPSIEELNATFSIGYAETPVEDVEDRPVLTGLAKEAQWVADNLPPSLRNAFTH